MRVLANAHSPSGLMKVSIERGLYKQVDVEKVSAGAHYTEGGSWLTAPVAAFIREQIADKHLQCVLDPFAGDGHLLRLVHDHFGLRQEGMDLHVAKWARNDSLLHIPARSNTLICTNPPYLAKYSARRKGVWPRVAHYFDACNYDDLYLLAIDRMLSSGMPIVAIVPETFIGSGLLRRHLDRVVVLERRNPFATTETPVCVACFDPAQAVAATTCHRDDELLGTLEAFAAVAAPPSSEAAKRRIRFNVADGELALKAVDGTQPGDCIRFLHGSAFSYDTRMIKVSSRLMTRIHIDGLSPAALDLLITRANAELHRIRAQTFDMVLSPFKGNNKAGTRRRRLDYRLARALIASVLDTLPHDPQQSALF